MKGLLFTSFLELVEEKFGIAMVDKIIMDSKVSGAYTSVGTYPHSEMVALITSLSQQSGIPADSLMKVYGEYTFIKLVQMHPYLVKDKETSFQFLLKLDNYIHVEVRKLYQNVDLPVFNAELIDDNQLRLLYQSEKKMGDVAEGLIKGCANFFGEIIDIKRKEIYEDGSEVEFIITKHP
jgi:hypothetical protein